ncbi:hypothetical protein I551_7312 [Mycobacterium ulcerans str. Harvey]|uniref:Uncharacterized protein n=1 Tax=Mycobacterium ulcerans str. Harvey TaxID=1299332 RepID=A0ABP3A3P3_MYCUL|nr:hypothetical protein I551_7312 [Mycobacterium ulcerans str. Harvey]
MSNLTPFEHTWHPILRLHDTIYRKTNGPNRPSHPGCAPACCCHRRRQDRQARTTSLTSAVTATRI